MPAEGELRTRISLDTDEATTGIDALTAKADQLRLKEAAAQEKMVRDLSTMSVEEFDRQIKAEEKLLEQLHIKQINDVDDIRSKLVEQFAVRRQEHEKRIRELDTEAVKIRASHDESINREDKLRKVIKDRNNEMAEAREDEIKGLQAIAERTRELHTVAPGDVSGAIPDVTGEKGRVALMPGAFMGMGAALKSTGVSMQKGFAPLLRILGPVGIAFSLEQVVEKLHKANEDLRVIRNNYIDIAATMGDLTGIGGMFIGESQGEMMSLQRDFLVRFADAFDEKFIPALAATIQKSGIAPGELAGLTETAAMMGVGGGVNPQAIGQLFVKLFREFEVPANKLAEETALLIDSAHNLRVPFEDLSKWTLTLAEQTRVYGFDVADSRRLVIEFAHELENGTVTIQNLIGAQKSMATINMSESMGIVQFLPQISALMETPIAEMISRAGGGIEQSVFIRSITQGQIPSDIRERAKTDPRTADIYGQAFDVSTGVLMTKFENLGSDLLQAIDKFAIAKGEEVGGGAGTAYLIAQKIRKTLGIDIEDDSIKKQNAILEGIRDDQIAVRKEVEKSGKDIVVQLKEQGEALVKERATLAGTIAAGIKTSWRDASEDIVSVFSRIFGGEEEDIQARMRTRVGAAAIGAFTGIAGAEGILSDVSKTLPEDQLRTAIRAAAEISIGTMAERQASIIDIVQLLSKRGQLEGIDGEQVVRSVFEGFRGLFTMPGGGEQAFTDPSINLATRLITQQTRQGILSGALTDISKQEGVQIGVGGIQINLSGYKDIEELYKAVDERWEFIRDNDIKPAIEEALNKQNMEAGQ